MSSNPSYAKKMIMPPATIDTGELHCAGASRAADTPAMPTATNSTRIASLTATTTRSVRATVDAPATLSTVMSTIAAVRNRCLPRLRDACGRKLAA